MLRRTSTIWAVTIAGMLLWGCGKSAPMTPTSSSAAASPPATGGGGGGGGGGSSLAGKALTKPEAIVFAKAVNLRPADVPGFKASPKHDQASAGEKRLERQMLRCIGALGGGGGLAEMSSKEFALKGSTGDFGVSSSVSVAPTAAIAAQGLSGTLSEHTRTCLTQYLTQLLEGGQYRKAHIGEVSVHDEAASAPGTTGATCCG
jgi:hypothetical protein